MTSAMSEDGVMCGICGTFYKPEHLNDPCPRCSVRKLVTTKPIADGPFYGKDSEEVNAIYRHIHSSGKRVPGSVLYLGYIQWIALCRISLGDSSITRESPTGEPQEFLSWPIIRVRRENYCRLA